MQVMHVSAHAAPGGDGSASRPFQTLAAAHAAWPADTGGKIVVHEGTYLSDWTFNWVKGGSPGNQLLITNAPGEPAPVIDNEGLAGFSIETNHYVLHGLTFQRGITVHQQGTGTGTDHGDFIKCWIHNMHYPSGISGGIVGGGTNNRYIDNRIDDIGDSSLDHCLYLNGSNIVVRNNVLARVTGVALHLYPDGISNSLVEGNVIFMSNGGMVMGTGCVVRNNYFFGGGYSAYLEAHAFQVVSNYFEGDGLFAFESGGTPGDFTGGFEVTDNTFNIDSDVFHPVSFKLSGNWDDGSLIDRNRYTGRQFRSLYQHPDTMLYDEFLTFAAWKAAVQALPYASAWEEHSTQDVGQAKLPETMQVWMLENLNNERIRDAVEAYVQGV